MEDGPQGAPLAPRSETERALARIDPQLREVMAQMFTEAQISFLLQKTPRREIRYRDRPSGKKLACIEHAYVTEKLNRIFGLNWSLEIVEKQVVNNEAIVKVRLTVRTNRGAEIVKEAYGGQLHQPNTELANTIKGACSDGLKKAASLLGIGIDLYRHDESDSDTRPVAPRQSVASAPRPAKHDYSWFWGQARRLGLSAEHVHARLGVKSIDELERQGLTLSQILTRLQGGEHSN